MSPMKEDEIDGLKAMLGSTKPPLCKKPQCWMVKLPQPAGVIVHRVTDETIQQAHIIPSECQ